MTPIRFLAGRFLSQPTYNPVVHHQESLLSRVGDIPSWLVACSSPRPKRHYSVSSALTTPEATAIFRANPSYISLHESTNLEKTQKIFEHALDNTLSKFHIEGVPSTVQEKWNLLQNHLARHHSYSLPDLNQNDLSQSGQALFGISNNPLIKKGQIHARFGLQDYVSTPSEFQWSLAEVGYPFTRGNEKAKRDLSVIQDILNQCSGFRPLSASQGEVGQLEKKIQNHSLSSGEKDAAAATLLATPHINEETFLHEIGCWNGQNLLNLLFYAALEGKIPKYCLGTDINSMGLSMAESASSLLNMKESFIRFYLANALDSFDPACLHLEFQNEIKLALRVIPVLDPSQAITFLRNIRSFQKNDKAIAIVSYATPNGEMYERNLKRAEDLSQPEFTKKSFSGGTVVKRKFSQDQLPSFLKNCKERNAILNTYYTEEGFSKLVHESGFKISSTVLVKHDTDNERVVALLIPK